MVGWMLLKHGNEGIVAGKYIVTLANDSSKWEGLAGHYLYFPKRDSSPAPDKPQNLVPSHVCDPWLTDQGGDPHRFVRFCRRSARLITKL